ncbi:hypothetical protein OB955_07890 [Halobacteria archaeon AArc-m2/3/4]|uniref:DUF8159 domain-containing protein n=1 Tax=Natronoglomus mannanivorans TaxID=2979990 RepID=A0AAP2YXN4_9EURY|nr:hypothetical protein [Halobacteria archaeon AArc-xg1-1]MCU4972658.1 hypothetical protein [Halobacteria archaeon AArc-m2/3/4]
MERRKILLGSGAALATALAGCMGGAEDDGNGNDERNDDENGNGDDKNGNGDEDDSKDHDDDVPGIDVDKLDKELSEYDISITIDGRDGGKLYVEGVVTGSYDEDDRPKKVPEGLGDSMADAIEDGDEFASKIDTVYVSALNGDGVEFASFKVEVEWVLDYRAGKLSEEELGEKIYETASY